MLEATAEDVIDQVPHGRWTRIDADVATMTRAWRGYRAEATRVAPRQARHLQAALDDLTTRAQARDGLGTAQAANDVSAPVVELLGRYASGHPVAIGRLDVIGRQIVLDVDRGDLGAAAASVARAKHEWTTLRGSVRRHHGAAVAARTDGTLARSETAAAGADGPALQNEANDLLELVDAMERLY